MHQEAIKNLILKCPGLMNLSEKDCEVLGVLIEEYGKQEFRAGEVKTHAVNTGLNAGDRAFAMCNEVAHQPGLTKREYIATAAMQGMLSADPLKNRLFQWELKAEVAKHAVAFADGLLKEMMQ